MKVIFPCCWRILLCLVLGALAPPASGDSPAAFNYQGVARNLDGTPVSNKTVSVRLAIRSGTGTGTVLYQEIHAVTTTDAGLFAVVIGTGTQVSGGAAFADLSWTSSTPRFLRTELSIAGGAYVDLGATQLVSVPYALEANHSSVADNITNTKLVPIATGSVDSSTVLSTDTSSTATINVQSGNGLSTGSLTVTWDETNNWYVVGVIGYDLDATNCVVLVSPCRNGNPFVLHSTAFIKSSGDPGRITVKFSRPRSTPDGELVALERVKCGFFIAIYYL